MMHIRNSGDGMIGYIYTVAEQLRTQNNRSTQHPLFVVQQKVRDYGFSDEHAEDHARWEFVTACLTEHGCKEYLRFNGHNLGETRIYAESGFRNQEVQMLRLILMGGAVEGAIAALGRIAAYPVSREDEIGYEGCRNIAKEALSKFTGSPE